MAPRNGSSGSNGRRRSDAKRDRIVRSAAKLFLDKGYESASINDIIDAIGGSKGTIYSNFCSKEKLFEAVVEQICADVTLQIDTQPGGSAEEQLTRIAESFVAKVLSPDIVRFHRLMTSIGRTFPTAGRLFYNTGPRAAYRIIADWIADQQRAGNIRSDEDPQQLAILFHDMLIGDQQLSWLTSSTSDKERAKRARQKVRLAVRVFLAGCAPR
jgi:TetR/AcrR family transcriptional repressor of mexJK operon